VNAQSKQWNMSALTRRLIALPAIVIAASLAFTGAASEQRPF
jgi:hypothetical protein